MAAALAPAIRRSILQGHLEGQSYSALARLFGVAYQTVRTLCLRYEAEGEAGLRPRYDRCGKRALRSEALFYRAACFLKRKHPQWGAPLFRLQLERRYRARFPVKRLPSVRTMQAWFKARGLQAPHSKPPRPPKRWAEAVHQVWQVDAKEDQYTAQGQAVCWLTVTDEHSGALLAARVFPLSPDQPGAAYEGATGAR